MPRSELPELRLPGGRPRFEPPPTWEPEEVEELESWDDEVELPAAWLPDPEPRQPGRTTPETPRELLERLARGVEAATRQADAVPQASRSGSSADEEGTSPILHPGEVESLQLREMRRRLSSPQSLREVLLLREILGPPRAHRRGRFSS